MRQTKFPFPDSIPFHGGEINEGKRKTSRPLARKKPILFTLKSRCDLFQHAHIIEQKIKTYGDKFSLRIYDIAVSGDHAHFVAMIPGRREYNAFIRSLTALLSRILGKGLWLLLPFSRVGSWGRDYDGMKHYHEKNRREASGEQPYEPRKDYYKRYKSAG